MTKRKPFTPHGQQTGAAPKTVEEVESSVSDYAEEIQEIRSEIDLLKKELENFKSELLKKDSQVSSVTGADEKVENIVKFLLSINNRSKLEKFNLF
jgi:predicted RNase H-like nuclease (RuvC/YqgF family)